MELNEIKELIEQMRKNKIKEIDLEQEGSRVRIVAQSPRRSQSKEERVTIQQIPQPYMMPQPGAPMPQPGAPAPAAPAPAGETAPPPAAPAPAPEPEFANAVEVNAPMVGTFYRAPSPESAPYVEVGSVVNNDSVLCIVEAMKLMNEIKAEMRGKVLKILVENGSPIEYGQPIFLIEPF